MTKSPLSNLPGWDIAERMVEESAGVNSAIYKSPSVYADAYNASDDDLRKAYALQPHARRFLLPREPGKPPVDPDAEQLARDVLECGRAGA